MVAHACTSSVTFVQVARSKQLLLVQGAGASKACRCRYSSSTYVLVVHIDGSLFSFLAGKGETGLHADPIDPIELHRCRWLGAELSADAERGVGMQGHPAHNCYC
jgi:hypothetical protein